MSSASARLHEQTIEHGRRKGEIVLIHRYALHVQCPWRIEHGGKVVTGRMDLYDHESGRYVGDDQGGSLQDRRCDEILAEGLAVAAVIVDPTRGDATITFDQGYCLRVWPGGSVGDHWRFFETSTDDEHVVFGHDGDL